MGKQISVVGAVIVNRDSVLCAQRGSQTSLPGLWEFPGGKIESGETPQRALEREVLEELQCEIRVGSEVITTTHAYDFATVTLTTFYCRLVAGTPNATEHADLRWVHPTGLSDLNWAPADVPAVEKILCDFRA